MSQIVLLVLLLIPMATGVRLSTIRNAQVSGLAYQTLFNRTENGCVCQMMKSGGAISSLNYFSINQTCQLFLSNLTSFDIVSSNVSTLIFTNQSAVMTVVGNTCDGFTHKDNWDIPGNDIPPSPVQASDYISCCVKCQITAGCQAFAYGPSTRNCWPKTTAGNGGSQKFDRISGYK